ncbi:MAG: hypothetical protein FJX25_17565 [Alphaproteobacteria bacterium]|nr:hypothetical protein [Alphaproteobacteria bacterium]
MVDTIDHPLCAAEQRRRTLTALRRPRRFHEAVAKHSSSYFPTLVMNDGAVSYRDLSFRSRSVTYDFISRAWSLFEEISRVEHQDGYPGARMVLASGFRMRGRKAGLEASNDHLKSILKRVSDKSISIERAIHEASRMRPRFDIIPKLQANFAFTKAYVAESSGSKGGLPGANFYLDLSLLKLPATDWIDLGPTIPWSHEALALSASFARVKSLPRALHLPGGPDSVLSGFEVAQSLAGDRNVLDALRAAHKPK